VPGLGNRVTWHEELSVWQCCDVAGATRDGPGSQPRSAVASTRHARVQSAAAAAGPIDAVCLRLWLGTGTWAALSYACTVTVRYLSGSEKDQGALETKCGAWCLVRSETRRVSAVAVQSRTSAQLTRHYDPSTE
jgi:hypothetical protein